jgi:SPP1 family predicted phage head-tail adaptor
MRQAINPGALRWQLTLQSKTDSLSASGSPTATWSDEKTLYGDIQPARAIEPQRAQQNAPTVTHEVTTYYDDAITADKRLLFGARVLYIVGVVNEGEGRYYMTVSCAEEV